MNQEHDFSMNYKKVSLKDPHTLDDLDIEWLPQATQKVVEKIFNSVDFISAETEREQVKCLYEQSRNREFGIYTKETHASKDKIWIYKPRNFSALDQKLFFFRCKRNEKQRKLF